MLFSYFSLVPELFLGTISIFQMKKNNWLHFEIFTLENQGFYEQRSCKGLTARIIYQYKRRLYNVHWWSQMSLEKCCGGDSQFKKMIKTPKNNHQIFPNQWLLIMKIYKGTFLSELESRNQNNVQTKQVSQQGTQTLSHVTTFQMLSEKSRSYL